MGLGMKVKTALTGSWPTVHQRGKPDNPITSVGMRRTTGPHAVHHLHWAQQQLRKGVVGLLGDRSVVLRATRCRQGPCAQSALMQGHCWWVAWR